MGFNFGGDSDPTDGLKEPKKVEKDHEVLEERATGRPHIMGWLEFWVRTRMRELLVTIRRSHLRQISGRK